MDPRRAIVIACPNHGGAFDCTPFCELCHGEQEITRERKREMNKTEKQEKLETAQKGLNEYRQKLEKGKALFLVEQQLGKGFTDYHRCFVFYTYNGLVERTEITWALATLAGYRLKDVNGRWTIAISGGNFDKVHELKTALENALGISRIRWGRV